MKGGAHAVAWAGARLVLGVAGGSTGLEFRPDRPVIAVLTGSGAE